MRLLYTAFLIILSAPLLFSQEIEFAPFQGNPVLRSHFSKISKEQQAYIQRHFGLDINEENGERDGLNGCPPTLPIGINIVESGRTIAIEIDTFGLAVDSTPPIMTLLADPPLIFGNAAYIDSIITVNYAATPGLLGAGIDTVKIHYVQGGVIDTVLKIVINIKRSDRTVLADAASVPAGGVLDYCLNDEFDFPYSRKCFRFDDCFANYDGDGYQFKYFRNDSCFVYLASRFPGTDTVCVEICDSIGICDIFKIPIHIIGDTLSIAADPFFEDFSTSDGPYPSKKRWLEDDVYVNNTFAKNPPSVGMATFDGLNSGGKPYELPGGGTGDQLTSKPIDLSSFNANSNVYLRFFVAPKGFGQEPEDDDFIVEFRDKQRKWVEVMTIDGTGNIPLDSLPPFKFYAIKIEDAKFFHSAFQMRFRADSSPGGYGDWWHLDYIYLDNLSTDVNNFSDFAFSTPPETFLKNYTAIPLRHLQADLDDEIKSDIDPYFVTLSNRSNSEAYTFSDSDVKYTDKSTGNAVGTSYNVASASESQTDPLSFKTIDITIPTSNRNNLITDLNSLSGTDPICIETEFSFIGNISEEANFKTNDTVRLNTVFSDYFAHDDGTAELQFFWGNANGGEEAAVQYKTNVDDSLKGIRIMFPHYTFYDIENQVFNLKVWFGHRDSVGPVGDPIYVQEFMQPYFADEQFDTLQGFTTYVLQDILENETALFIPADTIFYVGFEQLTSTQRGIPVGFDINNECGCNFRKKTNATGWKPFSSNDPGGAMMIRPVFGSVQNTWNGTDDDLAYDPSVIHVFPNPASDYINIHLEKGEMSDFKYMVFNQLGQMMQKGDLSSTLTLNGFIDGTYYLQAIKKETGETWIHRFIVTNNR